MSCGIYKIENKTNGKIYIGQSINIEKRWKDHKKKRRSLNTPLYLAMREDGVDNFSFNILEECAQELLNEKEEYWIKYYDSTNSEKGYNILKSTKYIYNKENIGKNKRVHLTIEQVQEIKKELANGSKSIVAISKEYNCSDMTIHHINSGATWHDNNEDYPIRKTPVVTVIKTEDKEEILYEKKKRYCSECGTEISAGTKTGKCRKCYDKTKRQVVRPSREELKKLIRTKSFLEIGRLYGVTDNTIRKWCDAEKLPRRKTDINNYSDEEWEKI